MEQNSSNLRIHSNESVFWLRCHGNDPIKLYLLGYDRDSGRGRVSVSNFFFVQFCFYLFAATFAISSDFMCAVCLCAQLFINFSNQTHANWQRSWTRFTKTRAHSHHAHPFFCNVFHLLIVVFIPSSLSPHTHTHYLVSLQVHIFGDLLLRNGNQSYCQRFCFE